MSQITYKLQTSDNTADTIIYDRNSTAVDNCWIKYPYYEPNPPLYVPVPYPVVPYKEPMTHDSFKDWLMEEKIKSLEERVKSLEAEKEAWGKKKKKK